ncbi:14566_t:CDS:2 [Funneliformis caledonium]|uniref:14566_t:CDS:1 n=1 Tax=Funneliformis caledonium TaxID=1117310 RepID=A0A9N9GED9_9GLOM|nr:14566_t:CDS:2 [Funneliformis caledonium]
MASCGNTCEIPVEDLEKFKSDCNASENGGGGGTISNSNTNLNPDSSSNSNTNLNSNSSSNSNTNLNPRGLFVIIIFIAILIMFVKRRKEQPQTQQTQPSLQPSTNIIYVADPLKPTHPTHPTNLINSTNPTHSTNPTQPTDFPQHYNPYTWPFANCMCSQEFYNNLVSCGNACNIPVDEPIKYESDCEIGNHPVNINVSTVEYELRKYIPSICNYINVMKVPRSELNLLYWRNWIIAYSQILWFIITLPVYVFHPLMAMIAYEVPNVRHPSTVSETEKWFFINGVMTNQDWLEQNCRYLEARSNKALQEFLLLVLEYYVMDERVKIVHLIAHSQGYTIVVLVIRRLRLELSYTGDQGCLSKLSVHAFSDLSRGFRNLGNPTIQDPAIMRGIINEISYARFGATTVKISRLYPVSNLSYK